MGEIHYTTGNIFPSPTQVIVNPVNCRGVMGAGLGRLSWEHVRSLMVSYLEPLECEVTIYGEAS